MDVLAELLPSAHLVKSETTAKDRKQKQKQFKKIEKLYRDDNALAKDKVGLTASSWDFEERRSGEDRRLLKKKRGRWLDTREPKDRRQQAQGIFVKI